MSAVEQRAVAARWDGGMRAVVHAGPFDLIVDEPESAGGTNLGPQPTDLLLASIASCFTLALVYAAGKAGLELTSLRVRAVGTYQGMRFTRIDVSITSELPAEAVEPLVPVAERVCYVTNTLRRLPQLHVEVVPAEPS